jgi:hypothetical protein
MIEPNSEWSGKQSAMLQGTSHALPRAAGADASRNRLVSVPMLVDPGPPHIEATRPIIVKGEDMDVRPSQVQCLFTMPIIL